MWGWVEGGYKALEADLKFSSEISVLLGKLCVRLSPARHCPKKQTMFWREKKEKAKKKQLMDTRKKLRLAHKQSKKKQKTRERWSA